MKKKKGLGEDSLQPLGEKDKQGERKFTPVAHICTFEAGKISARAKN